MLGLYVGHLTDAFRNGIQDWFRERDLKSCLADSTEWPLWLNEYTQALTISSENFKRKTPAQLTAGVFDEFHNLRHTLCQAFIMNKPERLQVALLHIKHLPQDTELYAYDLALWAKTAPELRVRIARNRPVVQLGSRRGAVALAPSSSAPAGYDVVCIARQRLHR